MFIREYYKTNKKTGKVYTYHSIMESNQTVGLPPLRNVLTLWKGFDVPRDMWPLLMDIVKGKLTGTSGALWPCSPELAMTADRIVDGIRARGTVQNLAPGIQPVYPSPTPPPKTPLRYDGVSQVSLLALMKIGLPGLLLGLGFTPEAVKVATCLIAARMERPDSELSTFNWFRTGACQLGPLVGIDFNKLDIKKLYETSDLLLEKKDSIDRLLIPDKPFIYNSQNCIFNDLTNTYFEGNPDSDLAKRGRSKEKRFDRPLISINILVGNDGYIKHSFFFPGNVSEPSTLSIVLNSINLKKNDIIIMDKGIATAENVKLLLDKGINYVVASREARKTFQLDKVTDTFQSKSNHTISVYQEIRQKKIGGNLIDEMVLRCHSDAKQSRDENIFNTRRNNYIAGLEKLNTTLSRLFHKHSRDYVNRRIGALDAKYGVSSHFAVELVSKPDDDMPNGERIVGLKYTYHEKPHTKASKPGVYALRTNVMNLKPRELWASYVRQNEIEAVFESLKSELGLRPVFHHLEKRVLGHLYISMLAYQCVNWIRNRLMKHGIHDEWSSITKCLRDVNCRYALSPECDEAETRGELLLEVEQAREYFKALGLKTPAMPRI